MKQYIFLTDDKLVMVVVMGMLVHRGFTFTYHHHSHSLIVDVEVYQPDELSEIAQAYQLETRPYYRE